MLKLKLCESYIVACYALSRQPHLDVCVKLPVSHWVVVLLVKCSILTMGFVLLWSFLENTGIIFMDRRECVAVISTCSGFFD